LSGSITSSGVRLGIELGLLGLMMATILGDLLEDRKARGQGFRIIEAKLKEKNT
jgi:hypothetical protein